MIACRGEGTVAGSVYIDNTLMEESIFQREAGYVLQTDNLLPNLTVKETLTYTSVLKFPDTTDFAVLESRVQDVMEEMGLRHVANERIGGSIERGISGGEKRRVSIALQLLQDPSKSCKLFSPNKQTQNNYTLDMLHFITEISEHCLQSDL